MREVDCELPEKRELRLRRLLTRSCGVALLILAVRLWVKVRVRWSGCVGAMRIFCVSKIERKLNAGWKC